MKKIMSIIVAIIMLVCSFSVLSFALNYGSFSYEIINDEVVITKYIGSNHTSITVPATIKEMPVVAICEGAFKGNTELTSVKVSEGIKDIGASTFENCTSLATITLPTTITHIGEKAIYNTAYYNNESNWKKKIDSGSSGDLNFGGGVPQIPWEDVAASDLDYLYLGTNLIEITYSGSYTIKQDTRVIADGAFAGCNADEVAFSSQLIAIGNNAFKDCKNLKKVIFYEEIEYIGDSAFEGCTSLNEINLPDKYIEMGSSSFYNTGCYNNETNWEANVLYLGTMVLDVRDTDDIIEIKEGTTSIVSNTLGDNDAFIPASVEKISDTAFEKNSNVTIFGYADTYAEEYASANAMKFIDFENIENGDVNADNVIDRADYNILCDIATTQKMPNIVERKAGDLDNDGTIDGTDVIILDLMLNNMPPSRLKGDVNGDNKVDINDYDLLVNFVSTNEKITDNVMFQRADVNEDGAVDAYDAVYLDLALNGIVALI